jgi:nucleotide-binding universal stress UspA family protein
MFTKILVPIDSSEICLEVVPAVERLVEGTAAEVTLLTVSQPPKATRAAAPRVSPGLVPLSTTPRSLIRSAVAPVLPLYAESRDQAVERSEHEVLQYLADVARPLVEAGCRVHMAVHVGEPVAQITRFARDGSFDLIAMATHGRSGLKKALYGSVTAGVIRSGVAPVLVVRPRNSVQSAAEDEA